MAIGLRCVRQRAIVCVYVVCVRCSNQNMNLSCVRGRDRSCVCVAMIELCARQRRSVSLCVC